MAAEVAAAAAAAAALVAVAVVVDHLDGVVAKRDGERERALKALRVVGRTRGLHDARNKVDVVTVRLAGADLTAVESLDHTLMC